MPSKIETLLEKYQGNAYPGMIQELADQLGVRPETIAAFEPGWAPIVSFKRGKSFCGWWAIPERDETAGVIGLNLQNQERHKTMYPGSKHGLVFIVNPEHEAAGGGYSHGAHNWVRTMDAGVLCPICLKPDGCIVSAENPADPKAAVCIRKKEGADRPMKFGYLHIRKAEGHVKKGSTVLRPSDDPVLVVEGFSDAATGEDLGFVSVGRPSNLACLDMLSSVLRGRPVVVIGENDDINPQTGQRPGHEGMTAAFQVLKAVCPDIKKLLPPAHIKDLRQWRQQFGLTREDLLAQIETRGEATSELTVFTTPRPLAMARAYLDSEHRLAGRYILRTMNSQWFRFRGVKYSEVDPDALVRGGLYKWLDNKQVVVTNYTNGATHIKPVEATSQTISNVIDAMNAYCPIEAEPPCWLNEVQGPEPRNLIAFANGILDVEAYLNGSDACLYDPTPDFFTLAALPYAFDPTATCPEWKKWLRTTLGDDQAKINLLREWFGYVMTPDTSMHKLMFFRGPRRAGKSVAVEVLQQLVGEEHAASSTFEHLISPFGFEPLIGKLHVAMNEAALPDHGSGLNALQVLLNIVGEDRVTVNRKNMKQIAGVKLTCRFTLSANEFLQIPDHAGALEARLNLLEFQQSFVGKEDYDLSKKLRAEIPGIAIWALEGLRRLREQGRFTMPASSQIALQEWRETTSPTASFVEECCDLNPQAMADKKELYDCWQGWSQERGIRKVSTALFKQRLQANAPTVISDTYIKGAHKFSVFRGIAIKPWAAKQFLGRPN